METSFFVPPVDRSNSIAASIGFARTDSIWQIDPRNAQHVVHAVRSKLTVTWVPLMRDLSTTAWYQLNIDDVLSRLQTRREGLTRAEAVARLRSVGPNALESQEGARPLLILVRQVRSPLIYILIVAGLISILLQHYTDAAVIFGVIIVDAVVGFVQEYKAEEALRALARLTAPKARVLRDGEAREVATTEVVPGDIVLLDSGVEVPADVRLFRAFDLEVDESILSGESLPVAKTVEPIAAEYLPLGEQTNMAFMGTKIVRGRGAGVVVATGMLTVLGRISADVRGATEPETPLQGQIERFSRLIAVATLVVTSVVFGLGLLRGEPLADIFLTAVATAVATVPEGLPITITLALAVGVWRMAQRNAIIRKLPAVETLGSCTTICSDKTGTLTTNQMTVTTIVAQGLTFEVTGVGYEPHGEIRLAGRAIDPREFPALELALRIGLLCNDASVYVENGQFRADGDPTEAALIVAALKGGLVEEDERDAYPRVDEIPFESERQYMATLNALDGRRLILVKGAPERILGMCDYSYTGSQQPLDHDVALRAFHSLASRGLRVLALAFREAPPGTREIGHGDVEGGLTFVGLAGMIDPPRPTAIDAVAKCQQAGIRVVMITGDYGITAAAIACQMGIARDCPPDVVDGRDLHEMSDDELHQVVESTTVYARIAPDQKLRIVRQLQRHGEVVAVTGDGVNDAPALKQADIGVAMGTGTDVAKEASDMVLADDNFASIYAAVEEGRVVYDNIRKVILFLIPTGLGLVVMVIASIALGLPLPFLPAQAVWINLVTNGTQDIAMAFEPPESGIGRRPPRSPSEGLLTPLMAQRIILVGIVIAIGTLIAFSISLSTENGVVYARTVAMTTMVLFQNFHIFNSRSLTRYFFQINPLSNRFLFISVVAALILHVVALYWAPLQRILQTEPLALSTWLGMVATASTVLIVVAVEQAIRRATRGC